jgi:hypothetical protein
MLIRHAVLVASVLAFSETAHAQTARGFALDRFQPAERGSEWFALDSLDLARHQIMPEAGITTAYGYRPLATYEADDSLRAAVVQDQVTLHAGGSVNLWRRARFGVNVPLSLAASGTSSTVGNTGYASASSGQALGDIRLAADARLFGETKEPATMALGARLHLPTGSTGSYAGDGQVRFEPRASFAGSARMLAYAAHLGFLVRGRDETVQGSPLGHEVTFSAGGGVRLLDNHVLVGPELYGSSGVEAFGTSRATPLEALLGVHATFARAWRAGAGLGAGLTRGYGTPIMRGLLSIEWAPEDRTEPVAPPPSAPPPILDRDKDGVADDVDACPDVRGIPHPEDPLTSGCASDRDKDFVADEVDACPDTRGARSNDPTKNGCPVEMKPGDKDGDNIPDTDDACEEEPGLPSDDPSTNGCAPVNDPKGGAK